MAGGAHYAFGRRSARGCQRFEIRHVAREEIGEDVSPFAGILSLRQVEPALLQALLDLLDGLGHLEATGLAASRHGTHLLTKGEVNLALQRCG